MKKKEIVQASSSINRMFGVRVEYLRNALGMTQEELAEKLNYTRANVSSMELGKSNINLSQVECIARAFGIPVRNLMKGIW